MRRTLSQHPIFDIADPTEFYEYLACSRPIIGIRKGELADLIESHDVGYAFRSLDDTEKIADSIGCLRDSQKMRRIRRNCALAVSEYSIYAISRRIGEILYEYTKDHPLLP